MWFETEEEGEEQEERDDVLRDEDAVLFFRGGTWSRGDGSGIADRAEPRMFGTVRVELLAAVRDSQHTAENHDDEPTRFPC
ncbi:hypothetical protein PM082_022991 [Marasmius tenuissimus]|nr:hypothetical protein PM082_022970 [Marasmius tenuissimus]KAJ8095660.1 hypothetical protein PM082_022985 [Marasmius tenuissimus]KAJ8095666.1 hypothetical protein PM082_022991 [Marasmius tenuissimus]